MSAWEEVQIGDCRLILGDCREVLPTLPKHDLLLTDPPYGIGYAAHPLRAENGKHKKMDWDLHPPSNSTMDMMLKKAKHAVIWGGNYMQLPPSRCWLAWRKPDRPPSMSDFELAWTNKNANSRMIECSIASTNAERVGHPTQKPLRVMLFCLSFFSDSKFVLDPFMGSGTTGVACARLGLQFTGIDRERKYFDIACERIDNAYRQAPLLPILPVKQIQEALIS